MMRALSDKTFGSREKLKLNNAITIIGNFITQLNKDDYQRKNYIQTIVISQSIV